jgi:mannosyltransferase OCH1-like enzyme
MPNLIKECIESQKIPSYEHILIDNSNYYHCPYVDQCVAAQKWGKAADYLRMYYLLQGGIFLDADTRVIKPFDDILDNEMFVCEEENGFIANGIVGVIPNHPMLRHYLKTVEDNFIGGGDLVFQPGMYLWTELVKHSQWNSSIKIYPSDWFLPYNHQTGVTKITDNTHTYHFYLKSWLPK